MLAVMLLLFTPSCVSAQPVPIRQPMVRHIEIDSVWIDFFAEYRELLPTERVLCLYGSVRNDTAFLNFIRPARMRTRSVTGASYDSCPSNNSPSWTANYLGTWHNHKVPGWTGDLCQFSPVDDRSFTHDKESVLELLSCEGRLMARSKFR
jgi:hypothetical protein